MFFRPPFLPQVIWLLGLRFPVFRTQYCHAPVFFLSRLQVQPVRVRQLGARLIHILWVFMQLLGVKRPSGFICPHCLASGNTFSALYPPSSGECHWILVSEGRVCSLLLGASFLGNDAYTCTLCMQSWDQFYLFAGSYLIGLSHQYLQLVSIELYLIAHRMGEKQFGVARTLV